MLHIEALPAFTDNYIWLLQDRQNRQCAVVDPGDAAPVRAWLEAHPGWQLTDILVTHHHADHVGGVERLKHDSGARVHGPANESIPARDNALADGDRIEVLGYSLQVIDVPGHTRGHIAYFCEHDAKPWLLSGDTLFAAGCGRLFEGTAEQMHHSLQRLAALPGDTAVYCTHEYTLGNLRFAQAVEPGNPMVSQRLREATEKRASGAITLPSSIDLERASNPFLRAGEAEVIAAASRHRGTSLATPVDVFAALRAWKDTF
jgi:hydroxyacylglutathione hydrolase